MVWSLLLISTTSPALASTVVTSKEVKRRPKILFPYDRADKSKTFWLRVDMLEPHQCWCWKLGRKSGKSGYGIFRWDGADTTASRVAWELVNGQIPDGLVVCHKCDTPSCCNPNHLFLGTTKDNKWDSVVKRRHAHGETNGRAKLTKWDILMVRHWYDTGQFTIAELAKGLKVGSSTIYRVVYRTHWLHIPEDSE